jgi:hypothetical protein
MDPLFLFDNPKAPNNFEVPYLPYITLRQNLKVNSTGSAY